jgi:hypothetical protein
MVFFFFFYERHDLNKLENINMDTHDANVFTHDDAKVFSIMIIFMIMI